MNRWIVIISTESKSSLLVGDPVGLCDNYNIVLAGMTVSVVIILPSFRMMVNGTVNGTIFAGISGVKVTRFVWILDEVIVPCCGGGDGGDGEFTVFGWEIFLNSLNEIHLIRL